MNRGSSTVRLLLTPVLALAFGGCTLVAPRLERARMAAQETAAVSAMRTIGTAEVQYYSEYNRYAFSLSELGPPAARPSGAAAAGMIPADLAAGKKNGYIFNLRAGSSGFELTAVPEMFNRTGTRTFYADESLTIHQHRGPEMATSKDPEV